ncbi:MAG: SRPBCC domain-containing protein [Williamsia sp.]|nr:SRPBCC domain-containing protein [Williamsia sp.]
MEELIVRKQIDIHAAPADVWDALTNPEKTKKYFFNCEVHSDWKVGSPITFKGTMLLVKKIEMNGKILAIEPQKLLKYNLVNDDGTEHPSTSIVTDQLSYKDGITTLLISDYVGDGEGAEDRYERSKKGWDKVLAGLKELVEEANPNYSLQ